MVSRTHGEVAAAHCASIFARSTSSSKSSTRASRAADATPARRTRGTCTRVIVRSTATILADPARDEALDRRFRASAACTRSPSTAAAQRSVARIGDVDRPFARPPQDDRRRLSRDDRRDSQLRQIDDRQCAACGARPPKPKDRAGVTRHVCNGFASLRDVELMDTPGVLPPKISKGTSQWMLALCGAVPRDKLRPARSRRGLPCAGCMRAPHAARSRSRGVRRARAASCAAAANIDYHNAAQSYIRAFNEGAFGRITLEAPDDAEAA